ncbi:MAG TPA: glycosyltransferase [Acidimicrobiales bacterium]
MTAMNVLGMESFQERPERLEVEIVVPVHNEELGLPLSIRRLQHYLANRFPFSWRITIADNASTDRTLAVAAVLAAELAGVGLVHLDQKGRGRALRTAWLASEAEVVAYMDVDLSTDLDALLPLVAPLLSGHSDIAIGSRLANGARVVRGPKRELISRSYNLVLKATLHNRFTDAQCGFKAVRADTARALLPMVEDNAWFFDTELLALAEHNGLRIHEVPVDWVDDPDSRVDIRSTAFEDLKGVWRLVTGFAAGEGSIPVDGVPPGDLHPAPDQDLPSQLVRFAGIGITSTIVFGLLFLVLAPILGSVAADVVALGLCALANTVANRRLTFDVRGRPDRARHYLAGTTLATLPLVLTLASLALVAGAPLGVQLVAITLANAVATILRFVLLRRIVLGHAATGRPA